MRANPNQSAWVGCSLSSRVEIATPKTGTWNEKSAEAGRASGKTLERAEPKRVGNGRSNNGAVTQALHWKCAHRSPRRMAFKEGTDRGGYCARQKLPHRHGKRMRGDARPFKIHDGDGPADSCS